MASADGTSMLTSGIPSVKMGSRGSSIRFAYWVSGEFSEVMMARDERATEAGGIVGDAAAHELSALVIPLLKGVIYQESDAVTRALRDYLGDDIGEILVDDESFVRI